MDTFDPPTQTPASPTTTNTTTQSTFKPKGKHPPILAWGLSDASPNVPPSTTSTHPITGGLVGDSTTIPFPATSRPFLPLESRYRRLIAPALPTPLIDDDRSDAATIGTSVAGTDGWQDDVEEEDEEDEEVVGFEAVKRWTLRVNSAKPDPVIEDASSSHSNRLPQPPLVAMIERPTRSPSPPAAIDPEVLASLVSTLRHPGDAEMVMDFVGAYRGPNVVDAVYERIKAVQETRERSFFDDGRVGGRAGSEWEWEEMERGGRGEDVEVGEGIGGSEGKGFSEVGEGWKVERDESVNSDWIVLEEEEEDERAIPSLRSLPKRALISILIYSGNPNLLKTCRRLSRLPLPELGHHLAQLVIAFTYNPHPPPPSTKTSTSNAPTLVPPPPSSSSTVSSAGLDGPTPTMMDPAVLLPRCARAGCLNRSALTLPCLVRMLGTSFIPTVDTIGAVVEIAARGRRWNTVRGALTVARGLEGSRRVGLLVERGGRGIGIGDLDGQHRRRHFLPEGEEGDGGLCVSLVANLVANHGAWLDREFFRDLVEEEGMEFSEEVIEHCAKMYNLSEEVLEYLRGRFGGSDDLMNSISASIELFRFPSSHSIYQ
ncbi:hypothetical protein HDU67_002505 [Dinochytrium kinnereticum]|nr:hypothetical protein HDU67_002505 [Dinochytrium kinnereticum]